MTYVQKSHTRLEHINKFISTRIIMKASQIFLLAMLGFWLPAIHAFQNNALYGGIGYFLENNFGRETQSPSGSPSTLGTPSYPLLLKYDVQILDQLFLSPTLTYTLITRSSAGGSAKVTTWHLMLPVGDNFGNSGFDWSSGLGILNRTIQGNGGTTVLSNGSGSATFALPGRSVSSTNLTFNVGSAYNFSSSRIGLDLMVEGLMSEKRNFNIMLSYSYNFMGGRN